MLVFPLDSSITLYNDIRKVAKLATFFCEKILTKSVKYNNYKKNEKKYLSYYLFNNYL